MQDLNNNEREALRILWDEGPLKPTDVQRRFGWAIENGTLRSVLVGLVDKGYLTRRKEGKAFVYRAAARKRSQFGRTMRRMADIFTGGSTAELILELLRQEQLSPEEIEELQRIANEKGSESKGT